MRYFRRFLIRRYSGSPSLPQQQPTWRFSNPLLPLTYRCHHDHHSHHRLFYCCCRLQIVTHFALKSTIYFVLTLSFATLLAYFMMMILSLVWVNTSQYSSFPLFSNHATKNVSLLPHGYPFHVLGNNKQNIFNHKVKAANEPTTENNNGDKSAKAPKSAQPRARRNNSFNKRKFWVRISDEVFIYSAHLDSRNFSSNSAPLPPSPNNLSATAVGNEGSLLLSQSPQVIDKSGSSRISNNGGGDDSDKLSPVMLVRIVGIKTVPPLREFIKGDILDWFRQKHEMEFSQKYECKLFFASSRAGNTGDHQFQSKLHSLLATRVTYTVIEEGIKVYAGCYINCYFHIKLESTQDLIRMSARSDNLQVAIYPRNVTDYPAKLIDVGTLMIEKHESEMFSKMSASNLHFYEKTLAICVRPLFGPFDDLEKLIQFISYYHVMGTTQFNFYSLSISSKVRKYLMRLSEEEGSTMGSALPRIITQDWNLPTGNTSELWDYGTLAALNDCLFSNINQHFVIFVDIDEFIVPKQNRVTHVSKMDESYENNSSLWTVIDAYNKTATFQYLIRNTFFCREFCEGAHHNTTDLTVSLDKYLSPKLTSSPHIIDNNNTERLRASKLPIFNCTVRTKRIWHSALRAKFIINPRQVLAVGHHLVTKYLNKKTDYRFTPGYSVQVDPDVGVMHHYRQCSSISSKKHPILNRVREEDRTMLRFQGKVMNHMHKYYLPEDLDEL